MKDLTTGDITLASTSDTGVKGNGEREPPSLSADGTKVAFTPTAANLDPGDTDGRRHLREGPRHRRPHPGLDLRHRGQGQRAELRSRSLSADGTKVAFQSVATNLDPADTDSHRRRLREGRCRRCPPRSTISGCSNGNSGTASIVDIRSYGPRPLGCPVSLGGAAGNDYADTTPILVGATLSMTIDWATGPNSYGVAAAKAGPTGTQWRFRLAITASPGHDTPATNQYLPAAGSGFTKTRLQGKLDVERARFLQLHERRRRSAQLAEPGQQRDLGGEDLLRWKPDR